MSRGRFEIVRTNAGHHVRIVGANGEPLATSEVLGDNVTAHHNAEAIVEIVLDALDSQSGAGGWDVRQVDEREVDER